MDKVLSAMLDPMLQVCVLGSATLDNIESATYMLNCLCAINVNLVSILIPLIFLGNAE